MLLDSCTHSQSSPNFSFWIYILSPSLLYMVIILITPLFKFLDVPTIYIYELLIQTSFYHDLKGACSWGICQPTKDTYAIVCRQNFPFCHEMSSLMKGCYPLLIIKTHPKCLSLRGNLQLTSTKFLLSFRAEIPNICLTRIDSQLKLVPIPILPL